MTILKEGAVGQTEENIYSEVEVNYILSTLKKTSPNKKKSGIPDINEAYQKCLRTLHVLMGEMN